MEIQEPASEISFENFKDRLDNQLQKIKQLVFEPKRNLPGLDYVKFDELLSEFRNGNENVLDELFNLLKISYDQRTEEEYLKFLDLYKLFLYISVRNGLMVNLYTNLNFVKKLEGNHLDESLKKEGEDLLNSLYEGLSHDPRQIGSIDEAESKLHRLIRKYLRWLNKIGKKLHNFDTKKFSYFELPVFIGEENLAIAAANIEHNQKAMDYFNIVLQVLFNGGDSKYCNLENYYQEKTRTQIKFFHSQSSSVLPTNQTFGDDLVTHSTSSNLKSLFSILKNFQLGDEGDVSSRGTNFESGRVWWWKAEAKKTNEGDSINSKFVFTYPGAVMDIIKKYTGANRQGNSWNAYERETNITAPIPLGLALDIEEYSTLAKGTNINSVENPRVGIPYLRSIRERYKSFLNKLI